MLKSIFLTPGGWSSIFRAASICILFIVLALAAHASADSLPPVPSQTPTATGSAPSTLESNLPELDQQLEGANEVRFDAVVKFSGTTVPIEVSGVLQGAKNVNIDILKNGRKVCSIIGNKDGGAAFFTGKKIFYPYVPSTNPHTPAGTENGQTINDMVGKYAALADYFCETLLRNLSGFASIPPAKPDMNWQRAERVVDGITVESESGTLTTTDAGKTLAKSLVLTYTQNPWSLKEASFSSNGSLSDTDSGFDIRFTKCDLINDVSALSLPATFAYVIPKGYVSFDEAEQEAAPTSLQPGATAPNFTVYSPKGTPIHFSSYKGKVCVIDLWATWCTTCKVSMPYTNEIANGYQKKGVVFLPICVWDAHKSFMQAVRTTKFHSLPLLFDRKPEDDSFATKLYKVVGLPTQFVIGRDGKIAAVFDGYAMNADPQEQELSKAIDKALAE